MEAEAIFEFFALAKETFEASKRVHEKATQQMASHSVSRSPPEVTAEIVRVTTEQRDKSHKLMTLLRERSDDFQDYLDRASEPNPALSRPVPALPRVEALLPDAGSTAYSLNFRARRELRRFVALTPRDEPLATVYPLRFGSLLLVGEEVTALYKTLITAPEFGARCSKPAFWNELLRRREEWRSLPDKSFSRNFERGALRHVFPGKDEDVDDLDDDTFQRISETQASNLTLLAERLPSDAVRLDKSLEAFRVRERVLSKVKSLIIDEKSRKRKAIEKDSKAFIFIKLDDLEVHFPGITADLVMLGKLEGDEMMSAYRRDFGFYVTDWKQKTLHALSATVSLFPETKSLTSGETDLLARYMKKYRETFIHTEISREVDAALDAYYPGGSLDSISFPRVLSRRLLVILGGIPRIVFDGVPFQDIKQQVDIFLNSDTWVEHQRSLCVITETVSFNRETLTDSDYMKIAMFMNATSFPEKEDEREEEEDY